MVKFLIISIASSNLERLKRYAFISFDIILLSINNEYAFFSIVVSSVSYIISKDTRDLHT